MPETIFSKIIRRELPSTIVFEDDEFIAIKNIYPKAPVHILLIPKKDYESLEAVELDNDAFYIKLLKRARLIAKDLKIADNYKLFMNVGKKVQGVQHLHLHIMGGWGKEDSNTLFFEE